MVCTDSDFYDLTNPGSASVTSVRRWPMVQGTQTSATGETRQSHIDRLQADFPSSGSTTFDTQGTEPLRAITLLKRDIDIERKLYEILSSHEKKSLLCVRNYLNICLRTLEEGQNTLLAAVEGEPLPEIWSIAETLRIHLARARSELLDDLRDFELWHAIARLLSGDDVRIRIPERFIRRRPQTRIETDVGEIKAAVQAQLATEE